MIDYTFDQLVDIPQVRQLLESHHLLSGMAYGLFDAAENNLVAVGWQDICVRFHRVNPVTAARCRKTNAYLLQARLHDIGKDYLEHRCGNGMVDVAIPIVISGKHMATFYAGQFFYDGDRPDTAFFRRQAEEFGFDPETYLAAFERVPVFSREYVSNNICFLSKMVNVLSETGLSNLKLVRDITERKDIETALRESEQQLRTLTENSPNIIVRYDRECRRVYANPAYSLETGIPSDQAQNAVLTTQWRPDISMPVEEYKSRLRQVMETGIPADIILEWRRPDTGMISSHIFNAVAELDQDGQVIGCLAIGHNISDRKKAEQLLHAKREQLASVARELSIAEERERLRIASVLHDHIGQILLLGRIKLGALADISKPAPVKSVIDEVIDLLDQATDDAHSLTVQLCPPMLSVSGLEAALQWLGKRMESDYGIVVEFSDDLRPKPLGDELRSILYQCARELLINTAKHANTDRAWLIVERKDDMYRLTVEDRGTGFNPDDISPDITKDYRFGLFSIQVRIEFLGGHMEIESHLAVGTRITILLPVKT